MNKPEKNFGKAIRVSVWKNSGPKGPFTVFRLERRFKDQSGQWKSGSTFTLPQALRLHALLGRAINEYLDNDDDNTAAT